MVDGYAYVGVVMTPLVHGTGIGLEAMALFMKHFFASWNLRKVYIEVPALNLSAFRSITSKLAIEEGCLKGYRYWDGEYYDEIIFGVYRSDFSEWCKRVGKVLGVPPWPSGSSPWRSSLVFARFYLCDESWTHLSVEGTD